MLTIKNTHRYSVSLHRYVRKVWELYERKSNGNMHELADCQNPIGLHFVMLMRQSEKITQMLMHMGSIQIALMHKSLHHLRICFTGYQLSQLLYFPPFFYLLRGKKLGISKDTASFIPPRPLSVDTCQRVLPM